MTQSIVGPNAYKIHLTLSPAPSPPEYGILNGDVSSGVMTFNEVQAMYASYGTSASGSILGELLKICPGLGTVIRPCPECKGEGAPLSSIIPHVNDTHQWSREKIAEWLDIIALDDPSVDLTIKPVKKETKREQPSIGPSAEEVLVKLNDCGGVNFDALAKEILSLKY